MPYFPMFVDLKGKNALIVGGGAVALRKMQKLLPFGASITVVAPEVLPQIAEIASVSVRRRAFCAADLRPRPALVIAATDQRSLNRKIAMLCKNRRIPVNVVDDPAACTFLFPALCQRGSFTAGFCTGGASPVAAAYYKERLQALLPERLEDLLSWLEQERQTLKAEDLSQSERARLLRALLEAALAKDAPLTPEETRRCLGGETVGSVALVGAGCGRADLITVRGLRLLRQCQAVVYDELIDPALLDAAPESALRIAMGKRSGAHSAPQAEINRKLIELARSGLRVVRLKGGDPYLFGRGGEEMQALREAGIPCTEVPGIPSAIGIPAEAGIPVTHRGVSRAVHIVTAHSSGTDDGLPAELAALPGTLVILMGLQKLPQIVQRLTGAGKSGDTPAAVISGGNSPNPAVVRAPLSRIAQAGAAVCAPAVIVVGEAAALALSAGEAPQQGDASADLHSETAPYPVGMQRSW